MDNQKKDYEWYKTNLKELYKEYPGKQLAISGEQVIGVYSTFEEALEETLKTHKAGTFIIQECIEEIVPIQYYNRAVIF